MCKFSKNHDDEKEVSGVELFLLLFALDFFVVVLIFSAGNSSVRGLVGFLVFFFCGDLVCFALAVLDPLCTLEKDFVPLS